MTEAVTARAAFGRRVVSAILYGAVVLGAVWYGPPWFHVAVLVGALLAFYELWRLFSRRAWAPSLGGGMTLVILFVLLHFLSATARARELGGGLLTGPLDQLCADPTAPFGARVACGVFDLRLDGVLPVVLVVAFAIALRRRDLQSGLLAAALTVLGALYCGWLLGYLIDIADVGAAIAGPHASGEQQRTWLLLTILPTWAADVAAYAVGSAVGGPKLVPHVSPGKTVSGTLAGVAAAVFAGMLVVLLFDLAPWVGAVAGALVGVLGLVGDLVESAIKRVAAVKDSGTLLPGHGGALDRLDSLIFVAPGIALFLALVLRFL